ncbi:type IV conjugative transfer system lipoprotein TraV [Pantoea allii]|uniref:Type IV conjugative transfer system lipoprotein TraV n=1 Tax=Pantoea allii TaxID=574096 RepID=A0ABS6VJC8_9GAMM|nr:MULTISPECIES: type IV conjugative transfer system lipoprotein TraV [Pantoea]MBW1215819.1 type IV conjugative transfer system lipoprotein TraV [Pantoea allii]MBW1254610.1 type IV conjugative transfer system lipoprotein TraV [Pantoea allii]MBW1259437.1 type IV conjugative transfer system lipoprotein TraV [Pantoea allii]MBW1263730.1 type IV conjugative transfer system lipoprotein TraV [Pantoea allii]MBW1268517.1 type IV conjugative transfer system lipoprotein TraV [Pantoea allii]
MQKLFACALLCAALTGCAGMNSDFDCNKTATDQCLTMSEASHLADKGKSLDDLTASREAGPKPAAEALATPGNVKPAIDPNRKVTVPAFTPRAGGRSHLSSDALRASTIPVRTTSVPDGSITPSDYSGPGHVDAKRIPDATQRLWIAPWVDGEDSFHQPAVVEFVKKKSRWDEDYRVISQGD